MMSIGASWTAFLACPKLSLTSLNSLIMRFLFQLGLKTWMAAALVIVQVFAANAQSSQVTLSLTNPVLVSPTELHFDVEIRNSGNSSLKLNGANIHTKYSPEENVPTTPTKPSYELVAVGPHFSGMSFLPVLAWEPGNKVQHRQIQKPAGSIALAPIIPTTSTKFFTARLITSAPMKDIDVLFHESTHPSISISVFIDGGTMAKTINVAGTPYGNVILDAPLKFRHQPVELTEFDALESGYANLVQWTTATERNSQYHIVERSADGKGDWVEIGKRKAAGTTQAKQAYSLEDAHPLPESNYRLKMVTQEGKAEYSEIVKVERLAYDFNVLKVFPIPTNDKAILQVSLPSFSNLTLSVTDVNGRLIQFSDMELEKGISEIQIDLTPFAAGTYFVKLDNGKEQLSAQVVKQ